MAQVNKDKSCYDCKNRGTVFYSCHSSCNKPDSEMTGDKHGISNGWFNYPSDFDPVWMTKECSNFENKD